TPKKVSGAQSLACCPSDSLEDLITHLVSGGIIDQLEAVDVEQHHRERQTVALCYGPLVCGHLKKVTPIVQACQAVGACHQLLACERLTKLTICDLEARLGGVQRPIGSISIERDRQLIHHRVDEEEVRLLHSPAALDLQRAENRPVTNGERKHHEI